MAAWLGQLMVHMTAAKRGTQRGIYWDIPVVGPLGYMLELSLVAQMATRTVQQKDVYWVVAMVERKVALLGLLLEAQLGATSASEKADTKVSLTVG